MKTLNWGIVSTGRIAEWFCGDFHKVEGAELAAVSSRSQVSAQRFSEAFNIPKTYTDYDQMLADPTLDCIYIGTPHTLHFGEVIKALDAGKAVLCEKPLVTTPDDCRTLMETAQRTGGFLMEAMWTYFLPAMKKAREW
ncbi:MAG: Gfo/Idh/MocA family oxidoreductase, partial [Parvularculaceae bacterium]|nr:Gfo/Idh/MocA family oxidoreductase [Parvularculaceae bacterium]